MQCKMAIAKLLAVVHIPGLSVLHTHLLTVDNDIYCPLWCSSGADSGFASELLLQPPGQFLIRVSLSCIPNFILIWFDRVFGHMQT